MFYFADSYRSKKRRVSDHVEIEDRLESLILRVGEKSSASLESNLEGLSSVLEADLSTYKAKILKILAECAVKLPDKCTIYTTLIGLLNTKNYNFGGECVELLIRSLKDCLKSGSKWEEARYLVRFIADLVNCHVISAGSLLQLLDNFVDAALEEGVPQVIDSLKNYFNRGKTRQIDTRCMQTSLESYHLTAFSMLRKFTLL